MTLIRRNVLFVSFLCGAAMVLAQVPNVSTHPEFEVASVKPNRSGDGRFMITPPSPGGRLNATNAPLKVLINLAYGVHGFQISGLPDWADSERFDIMAKAPDSTPREQILPMLRALIEDRFALKFHRETKELPIYNLVAAKSGLKLASSKDGSCLTPGPLNLPPPRPGVPLPPFCGGIRMGRGLVDGWGISIPQLLQVLSDILDRRVVDKTSFTGTFDVHLEYAADEAKTGRAVGPTGPDDPVSLSGPSIFTALQEQLGIRLESSKGPVDVLVIDNVERPSEN